MHKPVHSYVGHFIKSCACIHVITIDYLFQQILVGNAHVGCYKDLEKALVSVKNKLSQINAGDKLKIDESRETNKDEIKNK